MSFYVDSGALDSAGWHIQKGKGASTQKSPNLHIFKMAVGEITFSVIQIEARSLVAMPMPFGEGDPLEPLNVI